MPTDSTADLADQGVPTLVILLAVGLPVLAMLTVRVAGPGERLAVERAGRLVRVPRRRVVLHAPGLERVRRWPDPVELPFAERATTADRRDVRVLLTLRVEPVPPVPGERYADPLVRLQAAASRAATAAVADRDAARLADDEDGVADALAGRLLRDRDGAALGVVTEVRLDEVELLLHAPDNAPHEREHHDRDR